MIITLYQQKPEMKIIFLSLAIYAHAYSVILCASTRRYHTQYSLKDVIEDKCFENSHSNYAFEHLEEANHNYVQCEREAFGSTVPHPVEQHDEFCRYFRANGYYACIKNLTVDVLPCLDKTEIFFPQMILNAYNATLNKLCSANGLFTTEYIFNKLENNRNCIKECINEGIRCLQNLTLRKNFQKSVIDLNKHDYCIDMESYVSCTTEAVEKKCHEDFSLIADIFSELFLGVCKTY